MKRYLLGYAHPSCQIYRPNGFLPGPNFIGAAITKMILRVNPLFMYT